MQAASVGSRVAAPPVGAALAGIVVLAAALRFSTLGVQSYWLDEAYTAQIANLPVADVWHQVRASEGTPPLYYYLANGWRHFFGTSEFALRSLSALLGTATIPAAFYAGRELVSERAGLVTALLAALNPWLIWYSQEARSYALLVLVLTVALVFFARALRTGGRRDVVLWAASSAIALCTHYFAAFTIAPEALWLLVAARRQRRELKPLLLGIAGIAVLAAGLLPYALDQRKSGRQSFIHALPRSTRIEDFLRHPLAGELGGPVHGFVQAAGVLVLVAVALLLARGGARERRGALIAFGIAAGSVAIPLAFSFTSLDYLLARNSLAIVVPLLIVVAAGLGASRGGWIARVTLAGLCVLWMVVNVSIPLDRKLQRDDWRGAVRSLGRASQPRVVATAPVVLGVPLTRYLHPAVRISPGGAVTSELDLILLRRGRILVAAAPARIPGFRLVQVKRTVSYEADRYIAASPVPITPATLAYLGPSWAAFVQR